MYDHQTNRPPDVDCLLITQGLWREIQRNCPGDGMESGGKALGRVYKDRTAVACLHIGPGPRAERSPALFSPDTAYQQACYEGLVRRYPMIRLTLDYHLHPSGPPSLSAIDHQAIHRILGPDGWGLDGLAFLVLTRERQRLVPHGFYARRCEDGAALDLHPVAVDLVGDDDVRVSQLLSPDPGEVTVVVPEESMSEIYRLVDSKPRADGVSLYGFQRFDEGLVQVLATTPVLDAYRVGRAFSDAQDPPPCQEQELRMTFNEDGAVALRLRRGGVQTPCRLEVPEVMHQIHSRNQGMLDGEMLRARHVALVGLGSVGSSMALWLAQSGVGRFSIIDPDRFSPPNIARHAGDIRDLGRRKDRMLETLLLARNPGAEVVRLELDVRNARDTVSLEDKLGDVDLVLVTTDDPTANLAANRLALDLHLPALFVGVFDGGLGGEIFALFPDRPGCYNCVAGFRANLPPLPKSMRAHDYLGLRPGADLPPMNGLGIDIAHTSSVATSAALGLLGVEGRMDDVLTEDHPLLFVANGRSGWIFNSPFELVRACLEPAGCPCCDPDRDEDRDRLEDASHEDAVSIESISLDAWTEGEEDDEGGLNNEALDDEEGLNNEALDDEEGLNGEALDDAKDAGGTDSLAGLEVLQRPWERLTRWLGQLSAADGPSDSRQLSSEYAIERPDDEVLGSKRRWATDTEQPDTGLFRSRNAQHSSSQGEIP